MSARRARGARSWATWVAAAAAVSALACESSARERARERERELVRAAGGDPATVQHARLTDDDGGVVEVTTFSRPPASDEQVADRQRACEGGDHDACLAAGLLLQSGGDDAGAERAWRIACDAGVARACHELGNMLVNPNLKLGREAEGARWLDRGCTLGAGASCYFLADMVEKGEHVAADPARAAALYRRGCELGHHWACERAHAPSP